MKVNKKLLPIKGHFFLFNAGTAPLVPYLSTYARQLGFSSATVGLIYTVLPVFGLIAKPLFGVIADRPSDSKSVSTLSDPISVSDDGPIGVFKIQKPIFIVFQIVTIVSFSAIYLVPATPPAVDLDCGNAATVLRSCYNDANKIDMCKIDALGDNMNETTSCDMKCDMRSPKMWQTVCEHWHIPSYCYGNTDSINYTTNINKITVKDNCAYISSDKVVLDGYSYKPKCHIGDGYVDVNEPCKLDCSNHQLSEAIGPRAVNMTCLNKTLSYRMCEGSSTLALLNNTEYEECKASCDLDTSSPWRLMEICEGWDADVAKTCQPRTRQGVPFPDHISFEGVILLHTTMVESDCVYVQLHHIKMGDGSIHYPSCISKSQYQVGFDLFHSSCEVSCNNSMINELFQSGYDSRAEGSNQYTRQFWLFFLLMIISWIGQAVVVTFADAICFNLLGSQVSLYGNQRLWGSVGWGIFSLLTGTLIDVFSDGAIKDYTVAFVLMFVFMCGDVVVSCFVRVESSKMSINILGDVSTLLSSAPVVVFVLWTVAVGLSTGLLWQFLFWHVEDIAGGCAGYVKTLQGLISAIQTFGGEIPFMFLSGYILRKVGHVTMMSVVLLSFGARLLLYSALTNAWWVLPVEVLQGVTFGMFYPTLTSYANVVAPPGTETTVQGLVGAIFEGVGTSLGSLIGGQLYERYGGAATFRWFGIGSLVACALHVVAQYLMRDRRHVGLNQGYTTIIRYGQTNDSIFVLEDIENDR